MLAFVLPTVGPTSKQLVQLSTVKTQLEIPPSDTSRDAELTKLIDMVGAAIETSSDGLGRPPWRQTYQEHTFAEGGPYILPKRWPVESVSLVQTGLEQMALVTVDPTYYEIAGDRRDRLWYRAGWPWSSTWVQSVPGVVDYLLAYIAGWLMPGEVKTWTPVTATAAGQWVRPTSSQKLLLFQAPGSGTTGATEPAWPTSITPSVPDGTVTWQGKEAAVLPADIELAALVTVCNWAEAAAVPAGVQSETLDGASVTYNISNAAEPYTIPPGASRLLVGWR